MNAEKYIKKLIEISNGKKTVRLSKLIKDAEKFTFLKAVLIQRGKFINTNKKQQQYVSVFVHFEDDNFNAIYLYDKNLIDDVTPKITGRKWSQKK